MKLRKNDLVAKELSGWIAEGRYRPGAKLPTESELMKEFGVSRIVVRAAVGRLVEQGALLRRQGSGTYVSGDFHFVPEDAQLAVLMPSQRGFASAYNCILDGIELEAAASGRTIVFCNHRNVPEQAFECLERVGKLGIKGLLYVPMELPGYGTENRRALRLASSLGMELVLVDKLVRGGAPRSPSFVGGNGYDGIRQAVARLAALGHRRIAAVMNRPGFGTEMRVMGFIDAMEELGLELDRKLLCDEDEHVATPEEGRASARRLLSMSNPPTAIVCLHDWVARNLYEEAAAKGFGIPEELSVTGFDDLPFASEMSPALSTLRQPFEDIGRSAVRMLLRALSASKPASERTEHCYLPVEFVERASMAVPRGSGAAREDAV